MLNSHSKLSKVKQTSQPIDIQEELLVEIMKILDRLWQMRLIQKISRPISKQNKEIYCKDFSQRMERMNEKMKKFRINIIERNLVEETNREKSLQEELTSKNSELKKKVKQIETKFIEVLHEGSFKHFPKIQKMFQLESEVQLIGINEWAHDCIDKLSGASGDCC